MAVVEASQGSSPLLEGAREVGYSVGGLTSLGAVWGLVIAAFTKAIRPSSEIRFGEWISYSGALLGLFALVVEISYRAG